MPQRPPHTLAFNHLFPAVQAHGQFFSSPTWPPWEGPLSHISSFILREASAYWLWNAHPTFALHCRSQPKEKRSTSVYDFWHLWPQVVSVMLPSSQWPLLISLAPQPPSVPGQPGGLPFYPGEGFCLLSCLDLRSIQVIHTASACWW